MSLMTEQCTLLYPAELEGNDAYGEPIYGEPREVESPCWVEPNQTSEDVDLANQLVWGYNFYLPEQTDTSAESVRWAGEEYPIIGKPLRQPGGFTLEGFVRFSAEKVTG